MNTQISELQNILAEKNAEIEVLKQTAERYESALDRMGKDVHELQAEKMAAMAKKEPAHEDSIAEQKLRNAQQTINILIDNLKTLSRACIAVLNDEPDALELLQDALEQAGDPTYRVLQMVLKQRTIRIDEIASILVVDVSDANEIVDGLQAAGEVEFKDGKVIPAKKYREVSVPLQEWEESEPEYIFDSLESIVARAESGENIAIALETAVDILEQKLSKGGALVYEMRRTAGTWKRQEGDSKDLIYKIKEWKTRAISLS
jgi:hypothetical protein